MTYPTDPRFASSLSHGLDLLEAFGDAAAHGSKNASKDASDHANENATENSGVIASRPGHWARAGLTNKQLAERTGLSKASITRLTCTLATRGLVMFDEGGRGHRLGTTAVALGYPLLARMGARRLARRPMKQLADSLRATVSLAMRDRHRLVYVESFHCDPEPTPVHLGLGAPMPLWQTVTGRVWMACMESSATQPATITRAQASALAAAASDLRLHGYHASTGETAPGVAHVAVPLRGLAASDCPLVLDCLIETRWLRTPSALERIGKRLGLLAGQIERAWSRERASRPNPSSAHKATPHPTRVRERRPSLRERPLPGEPAEPSDRQFARTLARGIDLLLSFQPDDGALGNGELARRLDLSPSTVARLTHTLVRRGYLVPADRGGGYQLGAAALAVAHPMLASLRLRSLARPFMMDLAERLGGAVSLGLRHRSSLIYVESAWSTDGRTLPPDIGSPMPMLISAIGRAWLCAASPEERRQLLNRLRLEDAQGFARMAHVVPRAMAEYERYGYCTSPDLRPDVQALAVPLSRPVDGVRFAMNCGILAPTPMPARRLRGLGAMLVEMVMALESALAGGEGPALGANGPWRTGPDER